MKWLSDLIKKCRNLANSDFCRGADWTCETKGQWVTIRDHGEIIYNGLKSDMPSHIKRIYEQRITEIDKVWAEADTLLRGSPYRTSRKRST